MSSVEEQLSCRWPAADSTVSEVNFCDVHGGHLHRTYNAMLRFYFEACFGTAVQHCEQRYVDQLQKDADGKLVESAQDQGKIRKKWSSIFCRKTEAETLLEKLGSMFFEMCVSCLHKKVLIDPEALAASKKGLSLLVCCSSEMQ